MSLWHCNLFLWPPGANYWADDSLVSYCPWIKWSSQAFENVICFYILWSKFLGLYQLRSLHSCWYVKKMAWWYLCYQVLVYFCAINCYDFVRMVLYFVLAILFLWFIILCKFCSVIFCFIFVTLEIHFNCQFCCKHLLYRWFFVVIKLHILNTF